MYIDENKVHVITKHMVTNILIQCSYTYSIINTICGILLIFQFQHLQKQHMLLSQLLININMYMNLGCLKYIYIVLLLLPFFKMACTLF